MSDRKEERPLTEEEKLIMYPGRLQWRIDITYNPCDLEGPFWILFFLGPPPSDSNAWLLAPNMVGTVAAYTDARPPPGADYGRCMPPGSRWASAVELNEEVVKMTKWHRRDLEYEPGKVVSYLKENLNWRVLMAVSPFIPMTKTTRGIDIEPFVLFPLVDEC